MTDEHVVPLSLGGQHVLEKASCDDCAKITSKFERDVARELWGDARISYGVPSRRKKARPSHVSLPDTTSQTGRRVRVPYADYPAPMVFYKMHQAGLLQGLPPAIDTSSGWLLVALFDKAKAANFKDKYGIEPSAKFRHVPQSFARLLAKIGYGHILTQLEPDDFNEFCVPYILGKNTNLSFIVGGSVEAIQADPKGSGHVLGTRLFGDLNRMILVAEIRLFANNETPLYHAVVGEITGRDNVLAAMRKLGSEGAEISPLLGSPDKAEHWHSKVWPIGTTQK